MTDYTCQGKREEDYLPALKTAFTLQYNNRKTYIEKRAGRLIRATRSNIDDTRIRRTEITRKQKWEEKQLYGRFKQLTSDISHGIMRT